MPIELIEALGQLSKSKFKGEQPALQPLEHFFMQFMQAWGKFSGKFQAIVAAKCNA